MPGFLASVRYSVRLLLKSPGFTITAVLILGFGIGANTAIFSLIDIVLLRPRPYPNPGRMANIFMPSESSPDAFFDYPDFLDYVANQHTFSALGLSAWEWLDVVQNGNAERIKCSLVTTGAFQAFGVPFIIGRPFTAQEEQPGGPLLAVISEPFWRTHSGADPNVIGKNIVLNGYSFRIIGVSKPINSDFNDPPNVLLPLNTVDMVSNWGNWRGRDSHGLFCVGRLKDGVMLAQAQADLEIIQRNLVARYPEDKGYGVRVDGTYLAETKPYAATLWLLIGSAAALLLISTTNVATLLLARVSDRQREMMIRTAMGASRFRLNLQFVTPGYFSALQIPLLEGRDFDGRDKRPPDQRFQNPVIIVNRALAEAFFAGRSPIGEQIELPGSDMDAKTYTVIGLVENTQHAGLGQPSSKFNAYCPYYQHLTHYEFLLLRSSRDPRDLVPALRRTISSIDPDLPLGKVMTFDDAVGQRFGARKLTALLVTIFSGASLFLSAVGLYGVMAYMVSRQTREIGVRIAVGALSWNILMLILKRGFTLVGLGIIIGLSVAVALGGLLGSLLYGVGSNDPIAIGLSILILCLAALVACLLPALRAIRINQVSALLE